MTVPALSMASRRASVFGKRLSTANLLLLKAALLDGDAAIAAYQAWRPTFDLATISPGEQRLLPLLHHNMARLGVSDAEMVRFRGLRRYFWVRNTKRIAFAREVFDHLTQAGVPFIVIKGAALVASYFDDFSLRPMEDVDILVPEERLADATAALGDMHLLPDSMTVRQFIDNDRLRSKLPGWQFVGQGQNIDLHWKTLHFDLRPEADDQFWQGCREVILAGTAVKVLDPADQLLHVCAHAAQPTGGAAVNQWPADAALIIRASPGLSFERLVSEAGRHRLSAIMADGLSLLAEEFASPIPHSVISRLRAAASWTERGEMRLLASGRYPAGGRFGQLLIDFQNFRRGDRDAFDQPATKTAIRFVKAWTGIAKTGPAFKVAAQVLLGRPAWLRRLLRLDRYRALPALDYLPKIGQKLNFVGSEVNEMPLVAGWSIPEPTGRWTLGQEACMAWSVRGHDGRLTLLVDGYAFLHERSPRRQVELWLNDRRIANWHFRFGQVSPLPAEIPVPDELVRNTDVAVVTFLIKSPRSPAEIGMSADTRPLGLHLHSIALKSGRALRNKSRTGSGWGTISKRFNGMRVGVQSSKKPKAIWLDVSGLVYWPFRHVTGIQRVVASVAAEFLHLRAAGFPLRFCYLAPELGFTPLSTEAVERLVDRLLNDSLPEGAVGDTHRDRNDQFAQPPKTRQHSSLERTKRKLRVGLRALYRPLSRLMEPRAHERQSPFRAGFRQLGRRFELWFLRRVLRSDSIFQADDTLLNLGAGWQLPHYAARVDAVRRKIPLRHVVLIHDLIAWRFPLFFPSELSAKFVQWARDTITSADKLLTNSDTTRRDVLAFAKVLGVSDKPIGVIHFGRERLTLANDSLPNPLTWAEPGFVLCVGTVEVRKNHLLLLRVWTKLLERHDRSRIPALVWVGREGWMIDELLAELARDGLGDKLLWLGQTSYLPDSTLHNLYDACLFTMFPSFYEGWGLPVSESLAHGKLCIASSASSIPEAGGKLVDYHSPDDLEKCLALTERAIFDSEYRKWMETRIRANYRDSGWAEYAQRMIAECDFAKRTVG